MAKDGPNRAKFVKASRAKKKASKVLSRLGKAFGIKKYS